MVKTVAEILAERHQELSARIEECTVRTEEALKNTAEALRRSQTAMSRAGEIIKQNDQALGRLTHEPARETRRSTNPKR